MAEDYDDSVYLDMQKIEESINSGEIVVPKGLTPEERRAWVKDAVLKENNCVCLPKELRQSL